MVFTVAIVALALLSTAAGTGQQPEPLSTQKVRAEIEKLKAETRAQAAASERADLEAREKKAEAEKLEAEADKLRSEKDQFLISEFGRWFFGALGLAIPFALGIWQSRRQDRRERSTQLRQARVQAQLKAIELAMSSPTSRGVRKRLALLKKALPELLKDIPELTREDMEGMGFASYKQRFFKLVELIGEHPDSRRVLLEAYSVLLPEGGEASARLEKLRGKYESEPQGGDMN